MKSGALSCAALLFAAVTLLSACSGASSANKVTRPSIVTDSSKKQTESAEPVTLTIRHTQVKDTQKKRLIMLQDVVKATEAEVPGLTITLDGVEDKVNRFEKLRSEMAAGNPRKFLTCSEEQIRGIM
ncbi:hypothetical protein [Paenibacillus hexagrammi]|uniref:Lipoprotein n=1 Tax=Paenibacillus hexagrammi TaxID=2908839 RepID=A0ABY3SFQ0_9BACL|nr:hypothetical protein [Paenibacillus sp. YPD9-1]UJF31915.1 hypothetical protein L0M14_19435 [Paenibacillus sp. YPD9-1]